MLIIGIVLILGIGSIILLDVHRDRVMEEKIEELRQQVRPQQPGLLEQGPRIIPPEEPTPKEIAQWEQEMEEEMRFIEEFQPKTIMKIEGTESMRTETFRIDDHRFTASIDFTVALDDFPSSDKPAFNKITLYKVGEPEPVLPFHGITTSKEFLEKHEWKPGVGYPQERARYNPPGTIRASSSAINIGTGEFYFEIEVQNIDR